jgi:hypothetical protein
MATPITYTKQLVLAWNTEATAADFVAAREAKLNQMIDENKTDGTWVQTAETVGVPGMFGTTRPFVDQAAAEEYRTWLLTERAKLGHTPVRADILDI